MNSRTFLVLLTGFILGLSVSTWQTVSAERKSLSVNAAVVHKQSSDIRLSKDENGRSEQYPGDHDKDGQSKEQPGNDQSGKDREEQVNQNTVDPKAGKPGSELVRDPDIYREGARLLAEVMDKIKSEYVATVSDRQLFESAVRGMVTDLDPHSMFLTTEGFRDVKISTTGNYAGIGVELNTRNRAIVVVTPITGGPAERAGIQVGDKIVMVDNVPVNPDNIDEALVHMRGEAGSALLLGVTRNDSAEVLKFELLRERINLASVSGRMLEDGIAYVRISQFSETTHQDLHTFLLELARIHGKLQGLVVDLRNNPGGVLDAAVRVSDIFLDDGLIVSANGRTDSSEFEFSAHPGDVMQGAGLVVLVNAGSASASEIVAGALQDHARSIVIGEKTFGKGSVQTVLPLSGGQALKLTTSYYFTPSGASIHGRGIEPDIIIEEQDNADLPLQSALNHLKSARLQSRNH